MLALPDSPTDPLALADWLEIYALISHDRNSSRGDLESALRLAALFELDDAEAIEVLCSDVFDELEQRVRAAGMAYPFELAFPVVQVKGHWEQFSAYTFCLCLSYFGLGHCTDDGTNPRKLFEQLSCLAAGRYLGGQAVGFGSPRVDLPPGFGDAVTKMCALMGEGKGCREIPLLHRQDDALDLVAWKDFTDRIPSKMLMFGQCASGSNWEGKLGELDPRAFCGNWMQEAPVSPYFRSFFVPHRVKRDKWNWAAMKAGILFDRCRIAYWAQGDVSELRPYLAWSRNLLAQVTQQ